MPIPTTALPGLMSGAAYLMVGVAMARLFRQPAGVAFGRARGIILGACAAEMVLQASMALDAVMGRPQPALLPASAGAAQLVLATALLPSLSGIAARMRRGLGKHGQKLVVQAEARANGAEALLDMAEPAGHFGHWSVTRQTHDTRWSAGMYRIHGLLEAEVLPALDFMLNMFHAEDRRMATEGIYRLLVEGGAFEAKLRLRRPDKELRHVMLSATTTAEAVMGVMVDITEQQMAEARMREANTVALQANAAIKEMTLEDSLTGLSNRRQFDLSLVHEFKRAIRSGLPLGLVLVDIDQFKSFNAIYGAAAGDAALNRVALALKSLPRRPGDIVARFGGEEIAVLLPLADETGAWRVAGVMLDMVRALQIPHEGSESGYLTVSCGAAAFMGLTDFNNPLELVRRADQALYKAKTEGSDRVCKFDASFLNDMRDIYGPPAPQEAERLIKSRIA